MEKGLIAFFRSVSENEHAVKGKVHSPPYCNQGEVTPRPVPAASEPGRKDCHNCRVKPHVQVQRGPGSEEPFEEVAERQGQQQVSHIRLPVKQVVDVWQHERGEANCQEWQASRLLHD